MCDRKSSRRHAGKRESRSSGGAVEGGGGGGGVDNPTLLVDGKVMVDFVWELVICLW